ncbi:FecR domain-containing protein [Olivibacter sp. XZL3]|uniref:FecR domain-containing protein n=1 Tax=Olivibacter sp. XZL3 TaxID=1735116 RepID=UPI001065D152|nr:FecR domain-containing protein [Olivibacter sp. XZL3]
MQDPLEIARLIAGYIRQTLTEEEEAHFKTLLADDPRIRKLLESYKNNAHVEQKLHALQRHDVANAWERFVDKKYKKKSQIGWISAVSAAAILLLVLMGPWNKHKDAKIIPDKYKRYANDVLPGGNQAQLLLSDGRTVELNDQAMELHEKNGIVLSGATGELVYSQAAQKGSQEIYNTVVVPKGGTYKITLSDGTRVWINASSSLRFPVNFAANERKIQLKGEAYFEVNKDHHNPFKIEMNGSDITVLGTSFNVAGYEPDKTTTTLLNGAVKVSNRHSENILKPGQQAVVQENDIKVGTADLEKSVAWKDGYFMFSEDPIVPVLEQIARWYDLELAFIDKIPAMHIGGSVSRSENLSEVLEMLKDVSGLAFQVEGKKLIIKLNNKAMHKTPT